MRHSILIETVLPQIPAPCIIQQDSSSSLITKFTKLNMGVSPQDGNRSSQDPFCSAALRQTNTLWFLTASNILLAITSTLGNTLILTALSKGSCLHPPSKILLRSLALTDFFVGILVEPLFVTSLITVEYKSFNLCYYVYSIGFFTGLLLFFVSLLTLTAISVDRLLALLLGIRYRQVVTVKRVLLVVIWFWILTIGLCSAGILKDRIVTYYSSIAVPSCLVISVCCYLKIYQKLHHQTQIHVHPGQPVGHAPLNIARYRKTVSSTLWVQFSVLACYLPLCIVIVLVAVKGATLSLIVAWTFSSTLTLFNSTLHPILYYWKMRDVRRAVIETIRQISCF